MDAAEKLKVVEGLIEDFRWARPEAQSDIDRRTYDGLKEIALDIRATLDGACNPALVELEKAVRSVKSSKTNLGYATGPLVNLAQQVVGRWSIIRMALENIDLLRAETEMYQRMALDNAAEKIIEIIAAKWPHVARAWEQKEEIR